MAPSSHTALFRSGLMAVTTVDPTSPRSRAQSPGRRYQARRLSTQEFAAACATLTTLVERARGRSAMTAQEGWHFSCERETIVERQVHF